MEIPLVCQKSGTRKRTEWVPTMSINSSTNLNPGTISGKYEDYENLNLMEKKRKVKSLLSFLPNSILTDYRSR